MDGKFKTDLSNAEVYPDCPSLAWFLTEKVTGKTTQDLSIAVYGHKGSGKSTFCIGLAFELARCLAYKFNKKELAKLPFEERAARLDELTLNHFDINTHVKSCDPDGTFSIFSGDIMTKKHQVLIADDLGVSASSRDAMTQNNKSLGKIITICRPFKNILIFNTVSSYMVDKQIRSLADIICEMQGIDTNKNRSMVKAYMYSINQSTGHEYRKFFRWNNMRITNWFSEMPPKYINDKYEAIRMEKTYEMIESLVEDRQERQSRGNKREKTSEDMISEFSDKVMQMHNDGMSIYSMTKENPRLTTYWINKILAHNKVKGVKNNE